MLSKKRRNSHNIVSQVYFNFVFKKKRGEKELNHIFDRVGRSWVKYGMVKISSTLEAERPGFSSC